jgi:hypothetical protein
MVGESGGDPYSFLAYMPGADSAEARSEQPRQLGDVRRDPKRCDAAIMSGIGGKADVRDMRLKRRS